jgi:integrase
LREKSNCSVAANRFSVELRALRKLKRESPESSFAFVSERGSPFTTAGFRTLLVRLGVAAKFQFAVHPHMLRHACGYKLANDGVDTPSLRHLPRPQKHCAHRPLHRAGAGEAARERRVTAGRSALLRELVADSKGAAR